MADYTLLDEAVGPEYKYFLQTEEQVEAEKQKQLAEVRYHGEPLYITRYNFDQAQILRKHGLSEPIQKILVEGNFALPFK